MKKFIISNLDFYKVTQVHQSITVPVKCGSQDTGSGLRTGNKTQNIVAEYYKAQLFYSSLVMSQY